MNRTDIGIFAAFCLCLIGLPEVGLAQQMGVGIHPGEDPKIVNAALTTGGISFRVDLHWSAIEAEKGVLLFPPSYDSIDVIARDAAARKAPGIIVLDYGNKFYGGGDKGGELPKSPAAIQAFANYARFIATHFAGQVTQYEVYNEWNLDANSAIQPHIWGDATSYVNLLRAVYAAIKSVNPNAIVVGGAVGGTDTNWVNQFISAGGLAYVDAFSVHPYVFKHAVRPIAPTSPTLSFIPAAGAAESAPIPGTPEESIAWIDQVKAKIDQAATGRKIPVYVTEIGWPTHTVDFGVFEDTAAAYTQRFMLLAHTRPWIGGVWWYELIDGGVDPTQAENRFGLLRQSGSSKPAFNSLLQIRDFIRSNAKAMQQTISNGGILVTGLNNDGTNFCAAWLPTNDFKLSQPSEEVKSLLDSGYKADGSVSTPSISAIPLLLSR